MGNSEITKFLDKIRGKEKDENRDEKEDEKKDESVGQYAMVKFIKKYSDEYDKELLKGMSKEVDEYLILNGTVLELSLSEEEKETALKQRKKSGLPAPYIDITEGLDVQQRESTERLMIDKNFKPIIDWERLLYPHEFVDVKKFKSLINDKINSKNQEITKNEKQSNINIDKKIPYKIALLNEIGFFDLPAIKELNREKQRGLLNILIGGTDRQLKGNINVLNPNSIDNRIRYTSFTHEKDVKKYLKSQLR